MNDDEQPPKLPLSLDEATKAEVILIQLFPRHIQEIIQEINGLPLVDPMSALRSLQTVLETELRFGKRWKAPEIINLFKERNKMD